jgi:hypothetical protein
MHNIWKCSCGADRELLMIVLGYIFLITYSDVLGSDMQTCLQMLQTARLY